MEAIVRKPFQGVINIIRFNWHFYIFAAVFAMLLFQLHSFVPRSVGWIIHAGILLAIASTVISLLVSFYIYDVSGLYSLDWLDNFNLNSPSNIVNINAGFDETSHLLQKKFPLAAMRVVDFYDPSKHTEVSFKSERKADAAFAGTEAISTTQPFLMEKSADAIFLILAAHEIRSSSERVDFFSHLQQALKENGSIIVVEHLRNASNFLAYTFGFFHFFSRKNWEKIFRDSGLMIDGQQKITPFIVAYSLKKNGTAS